MTKTHTITGTRNGKQFIKTVEIEYNDNAKGVFYPKWINNLFSKTGYISYETHSMEPNKTVKTYGGKVIIEDFKIIK